VLLLRLESFIISFDVTFFESKLYFNTESHSFESGEKFLYFFSSRLFS